MKANTAKTDVMNLLYWARKNKFTFSQLNFPAFFLFTIQFFLHSLIFPQTSIQKKADKEYFKFAYPDAEKFYEKIIKNKKANIECLHHLADCYYKTADFVNAEKWYKTIYDSNKSTTEELFNYAQTLKAQNKYNDAMPLMQEFYAVKPNDSRGEEYFDKIDFYNQMKEAIPFFAVNQMDGNSFQSDFSATYYKDQIVFVSSRNKKFGVKRIDKRNNNNYLSLFVADKKLTNILPFDLDKKTKYNNGPVCFSGDGNTVYFTQNNGELFHIYRSKFANNKWNEEDISLSKTNFNTSHPALNPSGKIIYFVSDMRGGIGGTDIYSCVINNDGTLSTPVNMGKPFNTESDEMFPFVDKNGVIYFASNGHVGFGGLDVFGCIPNKNGSYTRIFNLGEPVNSNADDFGISISEDGKKGFLSSNRAGGKGNDDIYEISELRSVKINYRVKGTAYDKLTGKCIPYTMIYLADKNGKIIDGNLSDELGGYEFEVEPDKYYKIVSKKDKYADVVDIFNTSELGEKAEMFKLIYLEKGDPLALLATIKDSKTNLPLEGVNIFIKDINTGKFFDSYSTPSNGQYKRLLADKKIGDKISYFITLDKPGYKPKSISFFWDITKPGSISINNSVDLSLSK